MTDTSKLCGIIYDIKMAYQHAELMYPDPDDRLFWAFGKMVYIIMKYCAREEIYDPTVLIDRINAININRYRDPNKKEILRTFQSKCNDIITTVFESDTFKRNINRMREIYQPINTK